MPRAVATPSPKKEDSTYQSTVLVGVLLGIVLSYVNLVQFFIGVFVGYALCNNNVFVNGTFVLPILSSMCMKIQTLLIGTFSRTPRV